MLQRPDPALAKLVVHLNWHLDFGLLGPTLLEHKFFTFPSTPTKTIIPAALMQWTYHQPPRPFVKSAPRHSGRTCWANYLHTLWRFRRLPGICFGGFGCLSVICFGGFAVVSVCNLRVLRRFRRSPQVPPSCKKGRLPTVHGGFGGFDGCQCLQPSNASPVLVVLALSAIFGLVFCVSSLLPDTSILKPILNYHRCVPPWFS